MKDYSVDSIVTDPPYGINILGKSWDKFLPVNEIWKECHRVLKPGGHILAFSSARLYHHLAVSMELAGFETFNMLAWVYGSGLPKGKNLAREFDRSNDLPKPDDKFRKYLRKAINNSNYKIVELEDICGTSGMFSHYLGKSQPSYPSDEVWKILKEVLKLDEAYDHFFTELQRKREMIRSQKEFSFANGVYANTFTKKLSKYIPRTEDANKWNGWKYGKQSVKPSLEPIYFGQKTPLRPMVKNIKKYGVGALNISGCKKVGSDGKERELTSVLLHDEIQETQSDISFLKTLSNFKNDVFFESKPNKRERGTNFHPTLKPISLMRKLVKLVTPPNGICLDPFMGSGTTGAACSLEGFQFIGIEREKDFFNIAKSRIEKSEEGLAS